MKKADKIRFTKFVVITLLVATLAMLRVNSVCATNRVSYKYPAQYHPTQHLIEEDAPSVEEILAEGQKQFEREQYLKDSIKEDDVSVLVNVLYGEARGLDDTQKSAVIWCILNRLDNGKFGNTIYEVVSAPGQFSGYNVQRAFKEVEARNRCEYVVRDVLTRYYLEKIGEENVGRTLPKEYLFFYGKDGVNKFTKAWKAYDTIWDWSLESPYEG